VLQLGMAKLGSVTFAGLLNDDQAK
jgi:hypothetical protein